MATGESPIPTEVVVRALVWVCRLIFVQACRSSGVLFMWRLVITWTGIHPGSGAIVCTYCNLGFNLLVVTCSEFGSGLQVAQSVILIMLPLYY